VIEKLALTDASETCNLTYNKRRYFPADSINCVYIPSNELLFKMMRACVGCEKVEDLWIYDKPSRN